MTTEPSSTYSIACALCRWLGFDPPGACSTMIISISSPGFSGRSFDMSDVTLASWAIAVPVMRHSRTIPTRVVVMGTSFFRQDQAFACEWRSHSSRPDTTAAEPGFAQRDERALLDAAAVVSGL